MSGLVHRLACWAILGMSAVVTVGLCAAGLRAGGAQETDSRQDPTSKQDKTSKQEPAGKQTDASAPELPRGKKLVLTDGTYQVIREYTRDGDRVRYYSMERGAWEEVPASMVDWKATAKAAEEDEKSTAAIVAKVHKQEESKRMDNVTDVDASLPVGNGVFLPQGEGMFVVEGKTIRILDQVSSQIKNDKLRTVGQIISPVPIVPGKKNVTIANAHATLRLRTNSPEFYLREAPLDPEHTTTIEQSSRPADSGPDVELVRAKVTHNTRVLESIKTLFGEPLSSDRKSVAVQRWEVAPNVYRFTLSEPLTPGEYVLAEVLSDGLNLYVWDFGVDGVEDAPRKK